MRWEKLKSVISVKRNLQKDFPVRDHCHLSGKFRGILHNSCNLLLQKPNFIPVVGYNMMKYDEKFLIRELFEDVKIIAKNMENFISFDISFDVVPHVYLRFIDSYKFLNSSLEKLTENLLDKGKDNFVFTKKEFENNFNLFLRKGVYPYDYVTSEKVLEEKRLPEKEKFYSHLKEENISDDDYLHTQKVFQTFKCKTLKDYQLLYLKSDILLLADIFEQFRKCIFENYQLDPAYYLTLPFLALDCALKYTEQELELITDPTIYNFLEKGIRGGVSMVVKRFAEANNPYLENYDPEKENSYLTYLDANNLYGTAMSQPLPVSDFKFSDDLEWENEDCIVDCDISLSEELFEKFKDFPLCPEHKNGKLMCTFFPKTNYICHSRYLKEVLKQGYTLEKVNRVLNFKSKPWLKKYIEKNTLLRSKAKSDFEKDLWKLMNNAVYGKQLENVRERVNILFRVKDDEYSKKEMEKIVSKPTFKNILKLDEKRFLFEVSKMSVTLNKPIYSGLTILDDSKIIMSSFFYDYLKPKFGDNLELLYTDTDSFLFQVFTEDFYKDIFPDLENYFDTSNYPSDHFFPKINKKKPGYFKDEMGGKPIKRFCGLRSKQYAFEFEGQEILKSKGITKQGMKMITFDDYLKVLGGEIIYTNMNLIRSKKHELYTEKIEKKTLDGNDNKRKILEDGISTLPWGY